MCAIQVPIIIIIIINDRKLESCMAQFSFPSVFLAFWVFMISDIYAANMITDHIYALQKSYSFWLSPFDENVHWKASSFEVLHGLLCLLPHINLALEKFLTP